MQRVRGPQAEPGECKPGDAGDGDSQPSSTISVTASAEASTMPSCKAAEANS